MLITKKDYETWRDLVLSTLDVEKVLPRIKPLKIDQDFTKVYKRAEWHKRAKEYKQYDLLKRKRVSVERNIPEEYKRQLTFNDAYITLCPNPFSLDLYRGGSVCFGCSYCLLGETKIEMVDASLKPIKNIEIGDKVRGFEKNDCKYHLVNAKVTNTMSRKAKCIEFVTSNGVKTGCTEDHRWFMTNGQYKTIGEMYPEDKITTFVDNERLLGDRVLWVKSIGIKKVYDITTTSSNFIANGLYSHNCFSIRCIPILLSAFYDNWKQVLNAPISVKAVEKQFRDAPYKDDMVSRAINRRLVLHVGNNIENYIPHIENKTNIGYDFMTMMKDQDYPFILNTKSDIWDSPKFFKLLGELGKNVMVQITVLTPYDEIGKKIEPFAPTVTRRLAVAKTLNESGIKAVVRSEPYMFTISPTDDAGLEEFSRKLLDAKVPYINVGAYNTSVQSEEISSLFAQSGFSFSNFVNSQKGFYQTLVLEKALFHFREKGLKVGSFNPATYAIQDASDCCGFNFQGEPMKSGSDRFNTVEVAREIMQRGSMNWEELLRWSQPIYSPQYIERFKEFWENKPFTNVWWGNWSFGGRVHGMVPDGENGYRFDPKDIIEKRRHMSEVVQKALNFSQS
jgi:hypothetical protein